MKPIATAGLRHLSLIVVNLEECVHFYTDLLGMSVEWQPDANNFYLSSGNDNLALHRAPSDFLGYIAIAFIPIFSYKLNIIHIVPITNTAVISTVKRKLTRFHEAFDRGFK